jgi:hypothetical protein
VDAGEDPTAKQVMAAVHTALTHLESGGTGALPTAVEALKQHNIYSDVPSTLPESVRYGLIFAIVSHFQAWSTSMTLICMRLE